MAAAALTAAAAVITAQASSPKFFQAATQADFLKGDVDNLSIDGRGQLLLGPATDLVYETTAPFLWSLLPEPNGSLLVGTGNEGQVFRVDASGKGSRLFDASELEVHALAPAPNGGVFVATSPDGKIYKVDASGAATTFFDPEEKYLWALATDSKGNLFAATGQKGGVYKISPDGKGTLFYQSKSTHVTSLALDKAGNLLVGTESPGRVLKVDPDGKAFLLLDSPFQEIRALRFDDQGVLYVAAVSGGSSSSSTSPSPEITSAPQPAEGPSARAPIPVVTTEVTSMSIVDTSGGAGGTPAAQDRGMAKGAVYRIAPDGLWDQIWESRDDTPYDLVFDNQGRLIIGTGSKGKIFRLEGDPPQPTLLARAPADQVTALYKDPKGSIYYTTANPGKLFRLSADLAKRGSYQSEARDAQIVSSWGTVSWRASVPDGGRIEISTRSGNTAAPDETWSAWSQPYGNADGSPITSPKARYLQWRAVLSGNGRTPVLTSVNAAYLQRNIRPEVRTITVHPPGIVYQKPFSTGDPDLAGFDNQTTPERKLTNAAMSTQAASSSSANSPSLGRRTYAKGLQTLVWRAEDENDDDLTYEIDYRREGEADWKVLQRELTDPIFVWDTSTVPNGTYFVKVVASDMRSNAAELSLKGELVSSAFQIDNLPPRIMGADVRVNGARTTISFDVRDDDSPILRVEYSEDGREWEPIFPTDGIADSKLEHYQLTLDRLLGQRGLTLRATDAMNNVSTMQVETPAGRR